MYRRRAFISLTTENYPENDSRVVNDDRKTIRYINFVQSQSQYTFCNPKIVAKQFCGIGLLQKI